MCPGNTMDDLFPTPEIHNRMSHTHSPVRGTFINVAFWVRDVAKSRHFFSNILGVRELAAGGGKEPFVFYGDPGGFTFSINKGAATHNTRKGGYRPFDRDAQDAWQPCMTIFVNDLHQVIEACKAENIPVRQDLPIPLHQGVGWSIEVQDPDGNTWAIVTAALFQATAY